MSASQQNNSQANKHPPLINSMASNNPQQPTPTILSNHNNLPSDNPFKQKKIVTGLIVLSILVSGVAVGVILLQRRTDTPTQATNDKVDLVLNSPATADPGDLVTIDIIVTSTNNLEMTAIDLTFEYDSNIFTLQSIQNGNVFQATPQQYATNEDSTQPLNGIEILKDVSQNRMVVGAVCDQCFLGNADNNHPEILQCSSNITPQCYPKKVDATTNNNRLARATFIVNANASAVNSFISLSQTSTQIATIGNNTNQLGDIIPTTITIGSGQSANACDADFNSDGSVNMTDYRTFRQNFPPNPLTVPQVDLSRDQLVNIADYGIFRQYFGVTDCNN